jgi:DNA polymerase III delta subunit
MVRAGGGRLAFPDAERLLAGPAAGLPALVLAAGAEALLHARLVAAFRTGAAAEGSEFRRLEGDELNAAELEGALQSLTLFGAGVRLWIRECSKLEKAAAESLLAWARGGAEGVRVLATTLREPGELKLLESFAERAAAVPCTVRPEERGRWAERMAREAGLTLPAGIAAAVAESSPDLLAASQELAKLAALADASGKLPQGASLVLRGAQAESTLDGWVNAVLAGDPRRARAEAAALAGAGPGGTAALWAVAERALGALEPGGFGWPRRQPARPIPAAAARRILDAVYRADRALKRGELREEDLMDALAPAVAGAMRGNATEMEER